MLTMKQLLTSSVSTSPDGRHWEPAVCVGVTSGPMVHRWRDAWEVLMGRAVAVRPTEKRDLP